MKHQREGFCVWFTGLPCSGKTTLSGALAAALEDWGVTVTLLDGDIIRPIVSAGLGFSRADRSANVTRIGFVAREVVRHGGVAVCAAVSPYRLDRDRIRDSFEELPFFEVYVSAPMSVCEARDVKGMYARARRGAISNFTGIDDPYEIPVNPDLVCDTLASTPEECVMRILTFLEDRNAVSAPLLKGTKIRHARKGGALGA